MIFRKMILVFVLIFANVFCVAPIQAEAVRVKETVYDFEPVDQYQVEKSGRITGWRWKKKGKMLVGTKYRWNRKGKIKKAKTVSIQHPYIKEMLYGDYAYDKPGVYCNHSYINTTRLLARQSKNRLYFIFASDKDYYYLVTKRNGNVLYAGKISFRQIDSETFYENISDIRVMRKNKILITYQINNENNSNCAKSGICYLNVKTGRQQAMTMDTEEYYPVQCNGTYILAYTTRSIDEQLVKDWAPEIVLLSCKSGKVIRKIAIPDTKLPKKANEIYSKKYRIWNYGNKVYYLDNIGGIYACKVKKGTWKRLPGKYTYVNYKYPMIDSWNGIIFKKGKRIVFCVTYDTYGEDECWDWTDKAAAPFNCMVRYDIL